jgi:hypothetical protein
VIKKERVKSPKTARIGGMPLHWLNLEQMYRKIPESSIAPENFELSRQTGLSPVNEVRSQKSEVVFVTAI